MEGILRIRGSVFLITLIIFTFLQYIIPSRDFTKGRWKYMASNLTLVGMNNIIIGLLPLIPYQASITFSDSNYGFFNYINLSNISKIILGIILLDIIIYFQHRIFHKVSFLWRFHSMHHIDPFLDTTTGLRFHPIEIIISNLIKVCAIFVLGIIPISVIIFEVLLNGFSMFNHSNLKIPNNLEKIIRIILITPALHTIHHSKIYKETNSNYGFSVPWWDQLFKTYTPEGKKPQSKIDLGIPNMPKKSLSLFPGMLIQPFIK